MRCKVINVWLSICLIFYNKFIIRCASYKPIVDTGGRSGTFDEDKAKEISNDLQHCKQLAKENGPATWAKP